MLPYLGQDQISVEVAEQASCLHHLIIYIIWSFVSLGAKDFSNAVSSFCQVLRMTRGSLARSFARRRFVSAFGQQRKFPLYAGKTSDTQGSHS